MRLLLFSSFYLIIINAGLAQTNWTRLQDKNMVELRQSLQERPVRFTIPQFSFSPVINTFANATKQPANLATAPVPPAWSYGELAFFCKLEVKMEKAFNLPIKVRLGEVRTVEKMEGKLKTYFVE